MFKYIFIASLFLAFMAPNDQLQAQHFDPQYNHNMRPAKTWRDSGYYFMPTLVNFWVTGIRAGLGDNVAATVSFRQTDHSGLMFTGQAVFFFPVGSFPPSRRPEVGSTGLATLMLPQSLLFCPSPPQELGMGQDDPTIPLNTQGRIERLDGATAPEPVRVNVQVNDFIAN